MTDLLIVVDMQRDFVSGALGSEQARAIVPAVAARIRQAKAEQTQVAFTLDTHEPDYLNTREGRFLPVPHCIRDTPGWALEPDIAKECAQGMISFAKPTFGSAALCEYVRALAEEKGIAFTTEPAQNCPEAWANADRIEQILTILLDNAFKFTPAEGRVWIETEAVQNKILVRVRNSGDGIAPEDLPRIFEKGFTGYNGRGDQKASGLGLYLCRRVCAKLGHTITAESTPDHGTAIRIGLDQQAVTE